VDILIDIVAILAGFGLLIWSADVFVLGASATARNLGVSPLVIGLTVVGFGTSAPEMLVASIAAAGGNPGLAVGNALGSNITNIALILGITALIIPLKVHSNILKREYPLLLLATLVATVCIGLDNHLGWIDGLIFALVLLAIMSWVVHQALANRTTASMDVDTLQQEFEQEIPEHMPMKEAMIKLISGFTVLLISSKLLVWGAINIATFFGISDLIIGLTIVAIGTSLPELAASISSARKGEHDIAIGNIIGSNMFNTLGVLGVAGLIEPSTLDSDVLSRDLPIMFLLTLLLFIMAYGFRSHGRINRIEGGFLLALFIGYEVLLYFSATS
jgi:cation:H+ antiporter